VQFSGRLHGDLLGWAPPSEEGEARVAGALRHARAARFKVVADLGLYEAAVRTGEVLGRVRAGLRARLT
jgi:hypothetical protein